MKKCHACVLVAAFGGPLVLPFLAGTWVPLEHQAGFYRRVSAVLFIHFTQRLTQCAAKVESRSGPGISHIWPTKNGNLNRSGATSQMGPKTLSDLAWSFETSDPPGHIESSPVIGSNHVAYITSTSGGIYAVSMRDGAILWSTRRSCRTITPALLDELLYVACGGLVFALDAATGGERWSRRYAIDAGGDAWSVTASGGVVVVAGETPPGRSDGAMLVVGMDAETGCYLWHFRPYQPVYNFMPAVVQGKLYFIDWTGAFYCLELRDGSVQHYVPPVSANSFTTGGIAVGPNGLIYTTSNRQGQASGVVRAYDLETGSLRWSREFEMECAAGPAAKPVGSDGHIVVAVGLGANAGLYLGDPRGPREHDFRGQYVGLDGSTGGVLWTFEPPVWRGFAAKGVGTDGRPVTSLPDTWSNPIIDANGTIYVGWQGGIAYAIDAESGKVLSSNDMGSSFQGEAAIASGQVIFPGISYVRAFGALGTSQ